ncbi:MAG: hypothetical protein ACR2H3_08415 [Acidimicrobiales bacterium]
MRTYRFHSFTRSGATSFADALREDGMDPAVTTPDSGDLPGWGVEASGDDVSEGLLESLANFFGGVYEGEDLAGA